MDKYEYLFDDMFDREIREQMGTPQHTSLPHRNLRRFPLTQAEHRALKMYERVNPNISGNARLAQGQYRTPEEQETYKKESIERELP